MASTFKEVYSDFVDLVKVYVTKLDVTPLQFMRLYSKGMADFQRETELIEAYVEIDRDVNGRFSIPIDMLRLIEARDAYRVDFLIQNYEQYRRNQEKSVDGFIETPRNYSIRLEGIFRGLRYNNVRDTARMITMWNRQFLIFPDLGDAIIHVYYIPEIHPISANSFQWSDYDATNNPTPTTKWYPIDLRFETMFNTSGLHPTLSPYEQVFLDYAVAQYIQSQGNKNYIVYEKAYEKAVEKAKFNKQSYYREGAASYHMSPWS
jgi:hypothetical protein